MLKYVCFVLRLTKTGFGVAAAAVGVPDNAAYGCLGKGARSILLFHTLD